MEDINSPQGFIFGCTSETIDECLERCLFGLPLVHWGDVQSITSGTPLFLFVYTTRELLGGFFALEPGGLDLVPEAFGWRFPCQVRVKRRRTAREVIAESDFRPILQDNYYDKKKFKFWLNNHQVIGLNKLFNPGKKSTPKAPSHPKPPRQVKDQRKSRSNRRQRKPSSDLNSRKKHRQNENGTGGVVPSHKMASSEIEQMFDPEDSAAAIDWEKLEGGEEQRSTVCLGPLPGEPDFDVPMVVKILDETHRGKYDFLYVRYSRATRHCFVNLTEPGEVLQLVDKFHGKKWGDVLSRVSDRDVEIQVAFWDLQGTTLLAKKFCGEGFWHTGGASTCRELYDNRALFFYGAGARFASRLLPLPTGVMDREVGVSPLMAFLNGWPKLLREGVGSHSGTDVGVNDGQIVIQSSGSIDGKSASKPDIRSIDGKAADHRDVRSGRGIDAKSADKMTSDSFGNTDSEIVILDDGVETIDLC